MKTLHRWFESGKFSLLAHVDLPERPRSMGVVIVPPFGWEDVSSYRPLRFLARTLAENGIAVLRFDLPGAGDSSGDLLGSQLVESWIRSVGDAADELRAVSGVDHVALFGVRLGATLSAVAASRGARVQDLILWGASPSGRVELRELRAYAKMERWEFDLDPAAAATPGFEVGGFLITPEAQRDWEMIDLTRLSWTPRRVLLLSRDDLAPDPKVAHAFELAGCDVKTETGTGYAAIMAQPHESLPPVAVAEAIVRFLPASSAQADVPIAEDSAAIETADGAVESVFTIESAGQKIFGILCEPASSVRQSEASKDFCVLFLNAGGGRHTGPNRIWVEAARRHAAHGIASFRFDLLGIGESDGAHNLDIPELYQEQLVQQVERAMDALGSRFGFTRFATVGLCSGAFWAFHAAIRNLEVRGAVLLNPRLFFWDADVDLRRTVRRGTKGLINPADWWRVMSGGVQLEDLKRVARGTLGAQANLNGAFSHPQIPAERMGDAWRAIERHGTRVTLVFSEREPLLHEMETEGHMPDPENPRIRVVRIGRAGHTFRPRWAQQIAHDLLDRDIESLVNEERLHSVSK